MSVDLEGRTVVVTGSGSGLGAASARALAAAGAAVVVNDVSAEAAESTVRGIVDAGGRATAVVAPVGTSEVAQQLVDTAMSELGGFDAIVTNAGILREVPASPSHCRTSTQPRTWQRSVRVRRRTARES